MKVHVLHENPDWYAPLGAAFDAAGLPHEQWLLGRSEEHTSELQSPC